MERQFEVFKTKEDKLLTLTITQVDGKPTIKLKNNKQKTEKIVDISTVPKVFLSINLRRRYSFKILLNDTATNLSLYCTQEQMYNDCVNKINEVLSLYHKSKSHVCPDQIIEPPSEESVYISMHSPCQSLDDDVEIYMSMHSPNFNRGRESPTTLKKMAYESDYSVPPFHSCIRPLIVGQCVARKVSNSIPLELNVNIIEAIKLKEEICSAGGVQVDIGNDILSRIKVVELDGELWVSKFIKKDGNQSNLHIGDRVVSINNSIVSKVDKFVEKCKEGNVRLRIVRLPKARVFVIDNEAFKYSINKDLSFCNLSRGFDRNQSDKWFLSEINSIVKFDYNLVHDLTKDAKATHLIVLHQKSFLIRLNPKRRSIFSKRIQSEKTP